MPQKDIILFLDLWPSPVEAAQPVYAAKRLDLEILLVSKYISRAQKVSVDYTIQVDTYDFDAVRKSVLQFKNKKNISLTIIGAEQEISENYNQSNVKIFGINCWDCSRLPVKMN